MSFVGKILVVVQVILTILFMAFAGAVSATHTSWKEKHDKLSQQLSAKTKELADEQSRARKVTDDLTSQVAAVTQEAALKDAENRDLKGRLDTITAENDQNKTTAAVKTQLAGIAAEDNIARQDEAVLVREVLKKRGEAYEAQVVANKKLIDEQTTLTKNLESLNTRYETVLKEKAVLEQILVANKLSTDPKSYAELRSPPPKVRGKVLEASKKKQGAELIAISLGSDDGLSKGDTMTVYRSGLATHESPKFLGKIQIVRLDPDKAVGMVIDKSKNSLIQEGDDVTTGL